MIQYMLDTCICIYTIKNKPAVIRQKFRRHQDQLCVSSVTVMELIKGVEKSAKPHVNLAVVKSFLARLEILDFDANAAVHSGRIIADLEARGQRIRAYDSQIAGHARSRGMIVVTNNIREFSRVPGLLMENWLDQE